jgi:hypothetical protein
LAPITTPTPPDFRTFSRTAADLAVTHELHGAWLYSVLCCFELVLFCAKVAASQKD